MGVLSAVTSLLMAGVVREVSEREGEERRDGGKPITRKAVSSRAANGEGGSLGAARETQESTEEQSELAERTRRAGSTSTHLSMDAVHRGLSGVVRREELSSVCKSQVRVCVAAIQPESSESE